jgi:hypothetical protein
VAELPRPVSPVTKAIETDINYLSRKNIEQYLLSVVALGVTGGVTGGNTVIGGKSVNIIVVMVSVDKASVVVIAVDVSINVDESSLVKEEVGIVVSVCESVRDTHVVIFSLQKELVIQAHFSVESVSLLE